MNSLEIRVNNVMQNVGLIDVWRDFNGPDFYSTFYSARHNIYSRIDHFLMFNTDRHKITECRIGQRDLSEHSGVFLKLHLESAPQKTVWHINTALLNMMTFRAEWAEELKVFLKHNDNGEGFPAILYDTSKAFLRGKLLLTRLSKRN